VQYGTVQYSTVQYSSHPAATVAKELGCNVTDDVTILSCLQTKPAEVVLTAASTLTFPAFSYLDDSALSLEPFFALEPQVALRTGSFHRVPLIIGKVTEYTRPSLLSL
jgi:hypothetical protein